MASVIAVAALLGAGVGGGVLLVAAVACGLPHRPRSARSWRWSWRWVWSDRVARRAVLAAGAGVLVAAVTRWPVAALAAGMGMWWLPHLASTGRAHTGELARIEAVATWAGQLRDTLSAAAGLEQAIAATALTSPAAIQAEVAALAARLGRGEAMPQALRAFADQLADPTGDLVVAALVMAAQHRAGALAGLLDALAATARKQASMRLRVHAQRARTRTSVRVIVGTTLGIAAVLVLLNRGYLTPYDTITGQLVLAAVAALFAVAFAWMGRSRIHQPERVLTGAPSADQQVV